MLKIKFYLKCKIPFGLFSFANNIYMRYVYKCNTCEYAIFNYNKNYRLKNIYCKKLKDYLSIAGYRRLKFCNFYKNNNFL